MATAAPDFVLLGHTGFLGAAMLEAIQAAEFQVVTSRIRLQDRLGIEQLLDEQKPKLGVICAAGERGRPNISWCDSHPVETVDANITGQLNVAAACHARGLHVVLIGTGALYNADPSDPTRIFTEEDPPNCRMNVYLDLRQKMEELLKFFDNTLVLRVLYPVSSDLDPRGLIGKLARFQRVDRVQTSVTVLEDLCPLVPELVKQRVTGILNFVNRGTVSYARVVEDLIKRAPAEWNPPVVAAADDPGASRPACELDVSRLAAACGREIPDASASVQRLVSALNDEELRTLCPSRDSQL